MTKDGSVDSEVSLDAVSFFHSCREMRKSKSIINARVGYDGDDKSEDNHNSFDPKINIFGCRALTSITSRAYGRSNS